jgi:inorganic pyrophosphatase
MMSHPFPSPFYRWRPHPWHGLEVGPDPPGTVHAYIEITPFDQVKYEADKSTGYLRVDRPQRTSSLPPTLYGFIPRTFCAERVGAMSPAARKGDGDPLDICVLSERPINRSEVILNARVIGGILMVDHGEADDKIIAVLQNDAVWGNADDISAIPGILVERLRHYFATYKLIPGQESQVQIEQVYGCDRARDVVKASMLDYEEHFGS